MSPGSQTQGHWPFGQEDNVGGKKQTEESIARAKAKNAQASLRGHMRHDRLLVGGRAHVKKHGLS